MSGASPTSTRSHTSHSTHALYCTRSPATDAAAFSVLSAAATDAAAFSADRHLRPHPLRGHYLKSRSDLDCPPCGLRERERERCLSRLPERERAPSRARACRGS